MTLVEFLNARLDEDEKKAQRAAELCGCHPPASAWTVGDESTDGRILVVDDPHPDIRRKLGRRWSTTYDGLFAAEHIARHDPARVLARVKAQREMLETLEHGLGAWDAAWLAARLLEEWATEHADHPDYREEWRP